MTASLVAVLLTFTTPQNKAAEEQSSQEQPQVIVGLCVAITVIVVGAVAVYTIYSCLKTTPPPPPPDPDPYDFDFLSPPMDADASGMDITIETSPDLVHWSVAGVVKNTSLTDFVFYHTNSLPMAFYRAAIY